MSYADAAKGSPRPIAPLKGKSSSAPSAPAAAPTRWAPPLFPLAENFGRSTFDGPNRTAKDNAYARKVHAPNKFGVGLIIKGYQYEEHLDSLKWGGETAPGLGATPRVDAYDQIRRGVHDISAKERPAIVVATFATHYVCVPLFTYSGHGVKNFDTASKSEYISVWDHRSPARPIDQNPYGHLTTAYMDGNTPTLKPLCAAFFTYPVSRYYKTTVTVMGQLDRESANRLRNFYYVHVARPFKPLEDADARRPYQTLLQLYNVARRGEPAVVASAPPLSTVPPPPSPPATPATAPPVGDRKRPFSPPESEAEAEAEEEEERVNNDNNHNNKKRSRM